MGDSFVKFSNQDWCLVGHDVAMHAECGSLLRVGMSFHQPILKSRYRNQPLAFGRGLFKIHCAKNRFFPTQLLIECIQLVHNLSSPSRSIGQSPSILVDKPEALQALFNQ